MARKNTPPESTIGFDVAKKDADAHPSSYAARWQVMPDGTIIPKAVGSQDPPPALVTTPGENGAMNVFIQNLAIGTSGHTAMPWATAGSDSINFPLMNMAAPPDSNTWGDAEYFGMWDTVLDQRDGKWHIRRAIRWWNRDPIVYSCTKLLTQLCNSRVTFKSDDADAQQLIEHWFKQAMPHSFRAAWFLEYFRSGYLPILKTLIPYEPRNYKAGKIPMPGRGGNIEDFTYIPIKAVLEENGLSQDEQIKRIQAIAEEKQESMEAATERVLAEHRQALAEYKKAVTDWEQAKKNYAIGLCSAARYDWYMNNMNAKQYKWSKGQVPGGYTILDPLQVDLKGPATMQWLREPYLMVSGELINAVMNPTGLQKTIIDKLPAEIVQQIKDGSTNVWLSPNIATVIYKDKQPYERYPIPMMRHAFECLEMKWDIHAMDQATVRGVKSRILLVKVGNDQYPVTDPNQLFAVATIFNSVGRTGTFFWSHAIEMEWIEPDLSSFNNPDKYKYVNDEIRACYGVAPILVGQAESGGAIGNHVMNFKGLEQEVIAAQNMFLEFLNKEIKLLKAALSISADIQVDFERINLKDEMQFWQVVTQAVMNGILDHQTALETLGFHFPQIVDRMQTMQPLKKKGLFTPQPSANNMGPDGTPLPTPNAGGRQKNTNPPGKNKNKTGKSQPKKKAKATMRAVGQDVYVTVEADGDFDTEQRSQIAQVFGTDAAHVMTVPEFQAAHPDFDLSPDWPELTPVETVAATMAAAKMSGELQTRYEKAIATFKAENSDGARGAYLTANKRDELHTVASIETTFDYLKATAAVEILPNGWDKHFDSTKHALISQFGESNADQLEMTAFAMTALRFKKSRA